MFTALILLSACSTSPNPSGKSPSLGTDSGSLPDTAQSMEDTAQSMEDTGSRNDNPHDTAHDSGPSTDFREPGTELVAMTTGSYAASGSCSLDWTWYQPTSSQRAGTVLLSHGFMRNQDRMAGWAEHLSSWGIGVVTATLCHSSIIDIDPEQNARDLVALADDLGVEERLFMGHSNGGAVSIIAGALDTRAVAVLGLDPVDAQGDPAAGFVGQLSVPAYALMGESSTCNASASGTSLFGTGTENRVLRITESDHCDFESPSDWLCTSACTGTNLRFDDATLQATIRGMSTAFAAWMLGLDRSGENWWYSGGDIFDELASNGAISTL